MDRDNEDVASGELYRRKQSEVIRDATVAIERKGGEVFFVVYKRVMGSYVEIQRVHLDGYAWFTLLSAFMDEARREMGNSVLKRTQPGGVRMAK